MFANRYTAFVDACALVGVLKRNMLLTLAEEGFFRIRWSAEVLDEVERAVDEIHAAKGNSNSAAVARNQRERMENRVNLHFDDDACIAAHVERGPTKKAAGTDVLGACPK